MFRLILCLFSIRSSYWNWLHFTVGIIYIVARFQPCRSTGNLFSSWFDLLHPSDGNENQCASEAYVQQNRFRQDRSRTWHLDIEKRSIQRYVLLDYSFDIARRSIPRDAYTASRWSEARQMKDAASDLTWFSRSTDLYICSPVDALEPYTMCRSRRKHRSDFHRFKYIW